MNYEFHSIHLQLFCEKFSQYFERVECLRKQKYFSYNFFEISDHISFLFWTEIYFSINLKKKGRNSLKISADKT